MAEASDFILINTEQTSSSGITKNIKVTPVEEIVEILLEGHEHSIKRLTVSVLYSKTTTQSVFKTLRRMEPEDFQIIFGDYLLALQPFLMKCRDNSTWWIKKQTILSAIFDYS